MTKPHNNIILYIHLKRGRRMQYALINMYNLVLTVQVQLPLNENIQKE